MLTIYEVENVIIFLNEEGENGLREYYLCKKVTSEFNELIAMGKIIKDQVDRDVWELKTIKDSPGGDRFHILYEIDNDEDMLDSMVGFVHLWL